MNEHQLFSLVQQLALQRITKGDDPVKAIEEASKIADEMVKKTKEIMKKNQIPTQEELIKMSKEVGQ